MKTLRKDWFAALKALHKEWSWKRHGIPDPPSASRLEKVPEGTMAIGVWLAEALNNAWLSENTSKIIREDHDKKLASLRTDLNLAMGVLAKLMEVFPKQNRLDLLNKIPGLASDIVSLISYSQFTGPGVAEAKAAGKVNGDFALTLYEELLWLRAWREYKLHTEKNTKEPLPRDYSQLVKEKKAP